jgi:hypothetical protein
MEPIAAHALPMELLGDRVAIGQLGMSAVERRVEAGDLQQGRLPFEQHLDRCEIVGLMQRSERR